MAEYRDLIISGNSTLIMSSGDSSWNVSAISGGLQDVIGGLTVGTVLLNGGSQWLSDGGTASQTRIYSGGVMTLSSGGLSIGVTVYKGGYFRVLGGAAASAGVISSGGSAEVFGSSFSDTVQIGGVQVVRSGGFASGAAVGGEQIVMSGGVASATRTTPGGFLVISSGGAAYGIESCRVKVSAGGLLADSYFFDGGISVYGTVRNVTLTSEVIMKINSGGVGSGVNIFGSEEIWPPAQCKVMSGAALYDVTVSCGYIILEVGAKVERVHVEYGGVGIVSGAMVAQVSAGSRGSFEIESGAVVSGGRIASGGMMSVWMGGSALGIVQDQGGRINITVVGGGSSFVTGTNESGAFRVESGVAENLIINSGGRLNVSSNGVVRGVDIRDGGIMNATIRDDDEGCMVTGVNSLGAFFISGALAYNLLIFNNLDVTGHSVYMIRTTVGSGGELSVNAGEMKGSVVLSGGKLWIRGGKIEDTAILSGGVLETDGSYASAYNTVVSSGGLAYLNLLNYNTVIKAGGSAEIYDYDFGGSFSHKTVDLNVESGGSVSFHEVNLFGGGTNIARGTIAGNADAYFSSGVGYDLVVGDEMAIGSGISVIGGSVSGDLYVLDGAVALETVVDSGGALYLSLGGSVVGTEVTSGGRMIMSGAGLRASSTTIHSGGGIRLETGGTNPQYTYIWVASGYGAAVIGSLNSDHELGGTVTGIRPYDGDWYLVSGCVASGMLLDRYATVTARSGAVAYDTMISGSGDGLGVLVVASGAVSVNTELRNKYSYEYVSGFASGTRVVGGSQVVASGGSAMNTVVSPAGLLLASAGAVIGGTTVISGTMAITGTVRNDGTLIFAASPDSTLGGREAIMGLDFLSGGSFEVAFADNPTTYQYTFSYAFTISAFTVKYGGESYNLAVGGNIDLGGGRTISLRRSDFSLVLSVYGEFNVLTGSVSDGGYRLVEENFTVKSMVSCAAASTSGSAISLLKFDSATAANIYGGGYNASIGGIVQMSLYGGRPCSGLIYGGSFANNTAVSIGSGIELSIRDFIQIDNVKMLKTGTTAWVVGGGTAVTGGSISARSVTITIDDCSIGRVVGGAQATGAGVSVSVASTAIYLSNSSSKDIYGGGYAYAGGVSTVTGDTSIVITARDQVCMIDGNIYGGGANPYHVSQGGSSVVEGDATISFRGSGDMLGFSGKVSGDGAVAGTVLGEKLLEFNSFTGAFDGTVTAFDTLRMIGASDVLFTRSVEAGSLYFNLASGNVVDREVFFADFQGGFNFTEDGNMVTLQLEESRFLKEGTYSLIDAADLSLFDDATFRLIDYTGEVAKMAVGDEIEYGDGTLNLVDDYGIKLIYTLA